MAVPDVPSPHARLTGAVYVLYFLAASPLALRATLIVRSDPAATAARILGSEGLYRFTIATDLTSYGLYIGLTVLLYRMLRRVGRDWARAAVLFSLTGCLVQVVSTVALLGPLVLLDGGVGHALQVPQRQELAFTVIALAGLGYSVGLLFFGAFDVLLGALLARSRFVPRFIGGLLVLAGAGWIILSFLTVLAPGGNAAVQVVVASVGALAEVLLGLWLLVRGVDRSAWERAAVPDGRE